MARVKPTKQKATTARTSATKLIFLKYISDWHAEHLHDDKHSPVVFQPGLPRVA